MTAQLKVAGEWQTITRQTTSEVFDYAESVHASTVVVGGERFIWISGEYYSL